MKETLFKKAAEERCQFVEHSKQFGSGHEITRRQYERAESLIELIKELGWYREFLSYLTEYAKTYIATI